MQTRYLDDPPPPSSFLCTGSAPSRCPRRSWPRSPDFIQGILCVLIFCFIVCYLMVLFSQNVIFSSLVFYVDILIFLTSSLTAIYTDVPSQLRIWSPSQPSTTFGSARAGAISGTSATRRFDVGQPTLARVYVVCYCPTYNVRVSERPR